MPTDDGRWFHDRQGVHDARRNPIYYWLRVFLFLAREEQREGAGFEEMQC